MKTITREYIQKISNADLKTLVGEHRFKSIRKRKREALSDIEASANFQSHGYATFSHLYKIGINKLQKIADEINLEIMQS